MNSSGENSSSLSRLLPLLYVGVVLYFARPVLDWDIWWHLATGRWIVEHGTVPFTDPFSTFGQGKTWLAYSWLFEVLVYNLYSLWGLIGVAVLRAALSIVILLAVDRLLTRRAVPPILAAGVLTLLLVVLVFSMNERPWLFTILFTVLTLEAVRGLRQGFAGWSVWGLPLLFVLWANLHIQFILGLAVLGLGCVAPILDRWLGLETATGHADSFGSLAWRRLVILTVLCTLATLVNPYHVRLYGIVLEYGTHTTVFRLIQELQAPDFRSIHSWAGLTLALSAAFALGRSRRLSAFDVLLLAGSAYCGFNSRRDMWFVAVVAALLIVDAGPWLLRPVPWWRTAGLAILLTGATALAFVLRGVTPQRLHEEVSQQFPEAAVRVIEEQRYPGPLYNPLSWGGYLIWQLPRLPVAIDGRTNLHGDERIARIEKTWAGGEGWDHDPDLAAAHLVIARFDQPLVNLLFHDPRFRLAYRDDLTLVFVRQAPPGD
jgi:hypothetical protein